MQLAAIRKLRRGLHHLIVVQRIPTVPGLEIPVLYLDERKEDGSIVLQPLQALTNYFIANSAMSTTWMRQRASALGMLFDYLQQRRDHLLELAKSELHCHFRIALTQFQNHLFRGTLVLDDDKVVDPTGLYWMQSSPGRAMNVMRALSDFTAWVQETEVDNTLVRQPADIIVPATGRDTARFLYIARYKREVSFFAHIKRVSKQRQPSNEAIFGSGAGGVNSAGHVQFPRQHLVSFIRAGFLVGRSKSELQNYEDHAAKIVTMLCAFGGIRRSEALHVWTNDVQWANGSPVVFLHHPVQGKIHYADEGEMLRADFLRRYHQMEPRNLVRGKFHAGWKGIKCNSEWWTQIYWLPLDGITEAFSEAVRTYLLDIRPELMRYRRKRGLQDHPFLLVSTGYANHDSDLDSVGAPYTYAAYRNAWARAVTRLRKITKDDNIIVKKKLGLTPHGLRHLYGSLLKELNVPANIIQEGLHHRSPLSQLVYTQPTAEHVHDVLSSARSGLSGLSVDADNPWFNTMEDALTLLKQRAAGHVA